MYLQEMVLQSLLDYCKDSTLPVKTVAPYKSVWEFYQEN